MTKIEAGRLAFRQEGHMWNCYIAPLGTMEKAVWIGSIHMRAVEMKQSRKEQFMRLMKATFADMLKELGADVAGWDQRAAPDHERTKE
jgi:hypothetical protein